jgi:cell division protease FtsH
MTDTAQFHCTRPWYMRPPLWLLGLVVVGLVVFGVVDSLGRTAPISYSNFLDQLDAGNVASVTFAGTEIDGRFKHAVADTASKGKAQESFRSQVPAFGDPTLLPELRKEHVVINVVSASNWTAWLSRLPWPLVVFLVFILFAGAVRLVRGRHGPASGGMPMQPPMMRMMSGLFGKESGAAPGPGPDGTGRS